MVEKVQWDVVESGDEPRYFLKWRGFECKMGRLSGCGLGVKFFVNEQDFASFLVNILNAKYSGFFTLDNSDDWCGDGDWYDATATSGDGYATFYKIGGLIDCLASDLAEQGSEWDDEHNVLRDAGILFDSSGWWETAIYDVLWTEGGTALGLDLAYREG